MVDDELFHAVDGFDWVGFCRVAAPGVIKLGPYWGGHGCLVISFDKVGVQGGGVQTVKPDCYRCSSIRRTYPQCRVNRI